MLLRQEIEAAYVELKTRTHFEVLGHPEGLGTVAGEGGLLPPLATVPSRCPARPRDRGPGARDRSRLLRVNEAYQVLIDPESRSNYESILGPSRRPPPWFRPRRRRPASVQRHRDRPRRPRSRHRWCLPPVTGSMPVASVDVNLDTPVRLAEQVLQDARTLIAKEKYWDAIQKLEKAVELAKGTKANQAIRILLAQTTGRNPKWLKEAEATLLAIVREDPRCIDAYVALGGVYKAAGLAGRARAQFRKALKLDPTHVRARAEEEALSAEREDPGR